VIPTLPKRAKIDGSMSQAPRSTPSPRERRKKKRIQLTRGLIARFGTMGAIILDITEAGARIEHFTRLDIRKMASFRFRWQQKDVETSAQVVSCRVHRFAHGDDGTTVYQSGLMFTDYVGNSATILREFVTTIVARSLAEQVANARGIGPVTERDMPVFRSGVVTGSGLERDQESVKRLIPASEVAVDRGYLRCTLVEGVRWVKKWSRTADQPKEGFTVSAAEPPDHVDQLCENYRKGTEEERKLIRLLAQLSVAKA
jgi:hypothetical protein